MDRITDWVCPIHLAGRTHEIDDMVIRACDACPNPADCASNGDCEQPDDAEPAAPDGR